VSLVAGTKLGRYEIVAAVGAGGMGEVYRARDSRLGRDVAIKVLPEHLATDPVALARFDREARAVAAVSHPNVLEIYDVGNEDGTAFVVMELLEGETLRAALGRPGSSPAVIEIAISLAEGLAAAHARGVIHRDLKPENIFLAREGMVKLVDFGLARIERDDAAECSPSASTRTAVTEAGAVMGTACYMSPEQARGHETDARCDLFSLGCVLFEMIAGRAPFCHSSYAETMASLIHEPPPPLEHTLNRGLDRIVRNCLEKDPERRIQSASELALALRNLGPVPVVHSSIRKPARGRLRTRREPRSRSCP